MSGTMITLKEFHSTYLELGHNDVILDVRNPEEFAEAHIKGAINYPVTALENYIEELKKYEHIYIHCKRGGRAKIAFENLKNAGLTNLICIHDAGMDAWIESGFAVEKN